MVSLCIGFHHVAGELLSDGLLVLVKELDVNVVPYLIAVAVEDDLLRSSLIAVCLIERSCSRIALIHGTVGVGIRIVG